MSKIRIKITTEAYPENLKVIKDVVKSFCKAMKLSESDTHRILFSVNESCSNVVHHAYSPDDKEKKLEVVLDGNPKRIKVEVIDRGRIFSLDNIPDILTREYIEKSLKESGSLRLGIYCIRKLMDKVEIKKRGKEKVFSFVKYLT